MLSRRLYRSNAPRLFQGRLRSLPTQPFEIEVVERRRNTRDTMPCQEAPRGSQTASHLRLLILHVQTKLKYTAQIFLAISIQPPPTPPTA